MQIFGLVLNFLGSAGLVADNHRITQMFTADSFSLGWGDKYNTWF